MTNDLLTPEQCFERDVRLYGVTVARWLRAQKNFAGSGVAAPVVARVTCTNPENYSPAMAAPSQHRAAGSTPATGSISADKPFNLKSLESYL